MTEAEVEEHPENVARIEPIEKRVRTVSIEINYSVALKSDYKDIIFENCGIEDKPADAPAYETVSYTHLDVYKRQAEALSTEPC